METTTLGRTGRTVSRLGFGGAPAGLRNYIEPYDPHEPADREAVVAAIRRAVELGVTYFDTAPGYGDGAGERIFGEGLQGADPSVLFLATKVGAWQDSPVRQSLETSLTNLRRDRIDLLQVHGSAYPSEQVEAVLHPGGLLEQMERLRGEGLVGWLGFTVEAMTPGAFELVATGRFDVVQMQYNLLFQHPCDPDRRSGLMFDAEAQRMGIVTMRTATSGIFQRWAAMADPAGRFDYTPALIQYVLSNPMVDVALVGMRTAQQVEENLRTAGDLGARLDLEALFRRYV